MPNFNAVFDSFSADLFRAQGQPAGALCSADKQMISYRYRNL